MRDERVMRGPSRRVVRDLVARLEASETGEVWVDEEEFAGLIQRFQAACGLDWEWTKGALAAGGLSIEGHGVVRRYVVWPPSAGFSGSMDLTPEALELLQLAGES